MEFFDKILDVLERLVLQITDPIFGWLLKLPNDVAMLLIAAGTAFVMVIVRRWVTDQKWLGRADRDQKRLKELTKAAKKEKDKEAVARYKATKTMIQMRSSKYELKPFLVVIVPVLLLLSWCFYRIGFVSPKAGEAVVVKLNTVSPAIGSLAHIAPVEGLSAAEGGWVQRVARDQAAEVTHPWERGRIWVADRVAAAWRWVTRMPAPGEPEFEGAAVWKISGEAREQPYKLNILLDGELYEHELLIGQPKYSKELVLIEDDRVNSIELLMEPRRWLGFVGSLGEFFPPWMVAYLVIAIPAFFGVKKLLRIY